MIKIMIDKMIICTDNNEKMHLLAVNEAVSE